MTTLHTPAESPEDPAIVRRMGRIGCIAPNRVEVTGLSAQAHLGDLVEFGRFSGPAAQPVATGAGEIVQITPRSLTVLPDGGAAGLGVGQPVFLAGPSRIAPCAAWLGRVLDGAGRPLDSRPLRQGPAVCKVHAMAPPAATRRVPGARLETGLAVFNTFLPLVRGQRLGLFAGAGVGKSTLLGQLARGVEADVAVIALIGERGHELRGFVEAVLGAAGMARTVVVAATSDQPAALRRRAAFTAITVAERFRDEGAHVLFLCDSITRLAEAHREIALAAGEVAGPGGYPVSTGALIAGLVERAGPGPEGAGDMTAVFSVLVPGSDLDEPVADLLRGLLDGHVVLAREIAEQGRFPAVDLLRSVSRSLPGAATPQENALLVEARALMATHERVEMMIRAGLYASGSDARVDAAIAALPEIEAFLASPPGLTIDASFARLAACLPPASGGAAQGPEATAAMGASG